MSTDDTGTTDAKSSPGGPHAAGSPGADATRDDRSALSRRGLLAAAGAVGVAATAATVISVSTMSSTSSSTSQTRSDAGGSTAGGADAARANAVTQADTAAHEDGAIVVHVRDLAAGTLDVFEGTEYRQLRDPKLAAQLAAAARS